MTPGDREAITDTVLRMGWFLDRRDWAGLRDLFTERVYTDYTDLWGGEPREGTVDQLLSTTAQGSWRRTMDGLEATQHLITNVLVDVTGDEARATANVLGVHRLANPHGSPLWTLGGTYEFGLTRTAAGWRINAITNRISWVDGNQQVLFRAAMAAAAKAA
ncbi:nuclear transport factor 2 family protein [Actinophytocola gossypii]|uniref:Nuclear transport factor 2 family protein n=1 Tax=Actinophytocola gossypii TaxID=2812003 RepID=A0ABT2JK27_9PSEU|nr:nuclear transport factor 2 family protein [Actinophytocola gossypii]MCT2588121.1 nuclear transport factor 2 family protein [Actinophytocola gossypii]